MTRSNPMLGAADDYPEASRVPASEQVSFTVASGDDALIWSNTEVNRSAWDRLRTECPWSTAFQSSEFFDIWTRNYRETWSPLLVTARRRDGSLLGVMPLAENADLIVGVGAHQAEYQGPISSEADALVFVEGALAALTKHAPHRELRLRYLPAGVPQPVIEWLGRHQRVVSVARETQHLTVDR